MQARYLVFDQNKMRSDRAPEVSEMLINSAHVHFIIPDAAMIEMTKSPKNREVTLRSSLATLAKYPSRVHVTYSTSECPQTELGIGVSIANCLLYPAASDFLRKILRAVKDSTADQSAFQKIIFNRKHHTGLAKDYLNHNANKQRVAELIACVRYELTIDQTSALRAGRISQDERLNIICKAAPVLLGNILRAAPGQVPHYDTSSSIHTGPRVRFPYYDTSSSIRGFATANSSKNRTHCSAELVLQ